MTINFANPYKWNYERNIVAKTYHNILEPVLGRASKKESKTTLIPRIW
jgi:hypothetical protein